MDEKGLVEELLEKALHCGLITDVQKQFYLLRFSKGEMSFQRLQEEISQSPSAKQPPKKLWPYKFVRKLGRGGMGEVIEACHKETGQKVAIKKIRFCGTQDIETQENLKRRFIRECSLQAKLDHPNIVKVYDYGEYGPHLFLVTQLVEGETVYKIVEREKNLRENYYQNIMPPILIKMGEICDAIHYAHQNGIIHRDINPKNIMIDKAQKIFIMDFGLAKQYGVDSTRLTKSNELLGTPSYMSPEQWDNRQIGPLSDIYSLGATLFYIITGEPPYPEDPSIILYNLANHVPPNSIQIYNRNLPAFLNDIVGTAMRHDTAKRYQSAKALQEALQEYVEQWKASHSTIFRRIKSKLGL